ncbi:MAG: tRNA pseudouridine(38-40) synthase TruA [Candidatus Thermoplasmatota archaeon]|nr:tRNA pseudouridine(38-40) synthase TruA [Candidatus Thermoplasmatota archaeon]
MTEAVRIAIAVGYLGHDYSGSQVQPDVPTVQGELEGALFRLNWCERGTHPVTLSSRTDGGVDARMNIASFDISPEIWESGGERAMITALNDLLPTSIRVWAAQLVPSDFQTRNASSRAYLYRLQALEGWPSVSVEELSKWCEIFIGRHDFHNFCRPQEGRSTIKRVLDCKPWVDGSGNVLGFSIEAEGFVWNQVRRIASALLGLARKRWTLQEVQSALDSPENPADFGRSGPEWLTLWRIDHPDSPYLTEKADQQFELPLVAESPASGRAFRLWASKARGEQDQLHQTAWLSHLSVP